MRSLVSQLLMKFSWMVKRSFERHVDRSNNLKKLSVYKELLEDLPKWNNEELLRQFQDDQVSYVLAISRPKTHENDHFHTDFKFYRCPFSVSYIFFS